MEQKRGFLQNKQKIPCRFLLHKLQKITCRLKRDHQNHVIIRTCIVNGTTRLLVSKEEQQVESDQSRVGMMILKGKHD